MPIRPLRVVSISKHAGAPMSSRLMPPKVGSSAAVSSISFAGSVLPSSPAMLETQTGKASMSAKRLKSTAFPSITGMPAAGPMLPSPSTAVPSLTTATRLPLAV